MKMIHKNFIGVSEWRDHTMIKTNYGLLFFDDKNNFKNFLPLFQVKVIPKGKITLILEYSD